MTKRNWTRVRPTSLRHAMELCLDFAREHQRSVDRVADLMGLPSRWVLYKWMENGRLPAILVRPFEHACGIDFVTRYLATSAHKLLVDMPAGRRARDVEINDLQASFTEAVGHLLAYYDGKVDADTAIGSITNAMTALAWHRENVARAQEPELPLFEEQPA